MDVQRASTGVVLDELVLYFTDPEHGALQDLLDVCSLLRMDHLVVAILQFAEDLDILDVKTGQMLKLFIFGPG
jgi:hypothetical protein